LEGSGEKFHVLIPGENPHVVVVIAFRHAPHAKPARIVRPEGHFGGQLAVSPSGLDSMRKDQRSGA
jgi:hypothetical protein